MGKWEMTILNPAQHAEANSSYLQAEQGCQSMKEKSFFKKKKNTLGRWAGGCGTASEWEGNTLPQPALPSHGCGGLKSAVSLARPTLCSLSRARLSLRGAVQPLGLEEGLQGCPTESQDCSRIGSCHVPIGVTGTEEPVWPGAKP